MQRRTGSDRYAEHDIIVIYDAKSTPETAELHHHQADHRQQSYDATPSTAFCLPQVSRQVYSETCTLLYQLNTFHFLSFWSFHESAWVAGLNQAQKQAIRCVGVVFSWAMTEWFEEYFPNLECMDLGLDPQNGSRKWRGVNESFGNLKFGQSCWQSVSTLK
ncbi:hypothetical protein BU23DRAFT_575035 [Bimuria novae-zelandiae CBS 107.79]|uniref:Uncharacterized protein n=1 Tax=Bimuria novae-zelandiae CBS 107.79 TaxID=1447943 RepID=A0A6A5UQL7_9PLEO|nr:hypothetical protein BU23DRAFT_575035 [Bimuria novae-zelandiae CBS 107.79]